MGNDALIRNDALTVKGKLLISTHEIIKAFSQWRNAAH